MTDVDFDIYEPGRGWGADNATLQDEGFGKLTFSVETHVEIPAAVNDRDKLTEHLTAVFTRALLAAPELHVAVHLHEEDEDEDDGADNIGARISL